MYLYAKLACLTPDHVGGIWRQSNRQVLCNIAVDMGWCQKRAFGIKLCQIKRVELLAVVTPCDKGAAKSSTEVKITSQRHKYRHWDFKFPFSPYECIKHVCHPLPVIKLL